MSRLAAAPPGRCLESPPSNRQAAAAQACQAATGFAVRQEKACSWFLQPFHAPATMPSHIPFRVPSLFALIRHPINRPPRAAPSLGPIPCSSFVPTTHATSKNDNAHLEKDLLILLVCLGLDLLCEADDGLEMGVVGVLLGPSAHLGPARDPEHRSGGDRDAVRGKGILTALTCSVGSAMLIDLGNQLFGTSNITPDGISRSLYLLRDHRHKSLYERYALYTR